MAPEEERQILIIKDEMSRNDLQKALGLKDEKHFRDNYLLKAIKNELVEMTIPTKPKSSNQKYRLTKLGTSVIKKLLNYLTLCRNGCRNGCRIDYNIILI